MVDVSDVENQFDLTMITEANEVINNHILQLVHSINQCDFVDHNRAVELFTNHEIQLEMFTDPASVSAAKESVLLFISSIPVFKVCYSSFGPDAFKKSLASDNKFVKMWAIGILRLVGDFDAGFPLIEQLSSKDRDILRITVTSLGFLGNLHAFYPLIQLLEQHQQLYAEIITTLQHLFNNRAHSLDLLQTLKRREKYYESIPERDDSLKKRFSRCFGEDTRFFKWKGEKITFQQIRDVKGFIDYLKKIKLSDSEKLQSEKLVKEIIEDLMESSPEVIAGSCIFRKRILGQSIFEEPLIIECDNHEYLQSSPIIYCYLPYCSLLAYRDVDLLVEFWMCSRCKTIQIESWIDSIVFFSEIVDRLRNHDVVCKTCGGKCCIRGKDVILTENDIEKKLSNRDYYITNIYPEAKLRSDLIQAQNLSFLEDPEGLAIIKEQFFTLQVLRTYCFRIFDDSTIRRENALVFLAYDFYFSSEIDQRNPLHSLDRMLADYRKSLESNQER